MLELAGIRFLGVGGASAGAINAVLVAATRRRPDQESWQATQEVRAVWTRFESLLPIIQQGRCIFGFWSQRRFRASGIYSSFQVLASTVDART
jgi:predicted acylesterase/phospholipase RssA